MPGDDVERGVVDFTGVEFAAPFDRHPASSLPVLEGSHGSFEVARVGEAIGSNRTAVRKRELGAVILAHISARRSVHEVDLEFDAAWNDADLARSNRDAAEFREESERALLRNDEKFAVCIVEIIVDHRFGDEIKVRRQACLCVDVACRRHGPDAGDKGEPCVRNRNGAPAILAYRYVVLVEDGAVFQ